MPQPLQPGWDLTQPHTALAAFLRTLPTAPALLALGEPTHRVEAFPAWRNRLFQTLVEAHGYRSIALESGALSGVTVNDHVTSGHGRLDDVLQRGFSHGFGEVQANRDLVMWLRAHNAGRPEADQVRFYGFDAPTENMWAASPREPLLAVHAFLAAHLTELPIRASDITDLCGDDARWTNPAAAMDARQSVGADERARHLRWLADELLTTLETEAPRLAAQPDAFWHARLQARMALGLLRYHAVMADGGAQRVAHMLTLRDLMMADNLSAIAEREWPRGPTLVFAHNQHLQRHTNRWSYGGHLNLEWCPAGVHLTARLRDRYAFIATTAGGGAGVPAPPPDTLAGWLSQQSVAPRLYATQALRAALPDVRKDAAKHPAYFPLDPAQLPSTDGVLFLPSVNDAPPT